jgi:hypothetical protein
MESRMDPATIENAEIIFCEFYFAANGYACDQEILEEAFSSWQKDGNSMPMVGASITAALAINNRTKRLASKH